MKLEFPKVPVQTSENFASENFSLGDIRVIMDILSSKIYARPKYIIVQEVGSNARDANREAGRGDEPITIKLPNRWDDNFIIADKGIGISPSRMSDVFLKYGNSTKRDSNAQTGGFGIGAKTPFTYTDSFTVVTITDDDDGRHKRTYIAHKAEDMLRMSLVSTESTDEPTGTAIGFAVDPNDFKDFKYAVQNVCKYWEPRPKIEGDNNWVWEDERIVHEGTNWKLVNSHESLVLIDHIPYTLRLNEIYKDRYCDERKLLENLSIRLFFNTGDVSVSATREDLDYTDSTIKAIQGAVQSVMNELQAEVDASIAGADSLWAASIQWQNNRHSYRSHIVKPKWNGLELFGDSIGLWRNIDNTGGKLPKIPGISADRIVPHDYLKLTVFEQDSAGAIVSQKRGWRGRTISRAIHVNNNVIVALDDSMKSRPNKLRLQTLFEQNPNATEVAVVSLKSPLSLSVLERAMPWDHIPHVVLSTIPKAKKVSSATGKTYSVNAVKKLYESSRTWQWSAAKDRAPEDDQGGVYVLIKNGEARSSNGKTISKERVIAMANALGIRPVYGILYKYRNKISSDWEELTAKATLEAATLAASQSVKDYIKYGGWSLSEKIGGDIEKALKNSLSEIKDSRLVELLDKSTVVDNGRSDYHKYERLLKYNGETPEAYKKELKNMYEAIKDDYPCLPFWQNFDRYSYNMTSSDVKIAHKELIFYLNAKFAEKAGVTNANA